MREHMQAVLVALKAVRGGERWDGWGICSSAAAVLGAQGAGYAEHDALDAFLHEVSPTWPMFSGDECYPVPDPSGLRDPAIMYDRAQAEDALWEGEYGALRKQLLDFLIQKAEELCDAA